MKNPVFILSLFDTGLYAARALKREKITVYGFDHKINNPGFYSKYIIPFEVAHPIFNPEKLFQEISDKRNQFNKKPVLIPASEEYLLFVHNYRRQLAEGFNFIIPEHEVLEKVLFKSEQNALAKTANIDFPKLINISPDVSLNKFINRLNYPFLIKSNDQTNWKTKVDTKAFLIKNEEEFLKIGKELQKQKINFLCQEIIEGSIENNYEFNALVYNGEIIHKNVIRKIRQYPPDYGAATCIETTNNEFIDKLGTKFVKENKIEGFSNTEFKYNVKDDKYYFIETNARVWLQISLTNKVNQNFVTSYYNLLTDELNFTKRNSNTNKKLKWVDLIGDSMVFIKHRKKLELNGLQYFKSLAHTKYYGLLDLSDLKPFLKAIKEIIKRNLKK